MTTTIIILIGILIIGVVANTNRQTNEAFDSIGSVTSLFNYGFSLTGGLRATTRDTAYKNALILGPSGSGKTSTVLFGTLNALVRGNNSMCVLDVGGEIYKAYSGYLSTKANIYCIDLGEHTDGFNPIEAFGNSTSEIQKLANILIKNSGLAGSGDAYWTASAENIIATGIQLLWYQEPQYRTMINLVRLIQTLAAEPAKIDARIVKTKDKELIAAYKAIISVGDKTLQSSISTALVSLKAFKNPDVARTTAMSTFSFKDFRKTKSILFITIPVLETQFLAPFTSTLFEHLFKITLERIPDKSDASIFAIIDEMPTLRFQNLGLVYANIRKYKGGCLGLVQDEEMLKMAWTAAEVQAIKTNSYSKVYLLGQPLATCKMLEETIGKDAQHKPVMAAADIRTSEDAIIVVGNKKPMKERMIPYYDHWLLKQRASYPPYQQQKKIPFDSPPLIQF